MMTGFGQFGPLEMGGMFTVMKVREGLGARDYSDPVPYKNPEGTLRMRSKVATDQSIPRPGSHSTKPVAPPLHRHRKGRQADDDRHLNSQRRLQNLTTERRENMKSIASFAFALALSIGP
jgi:hypothetical protein